MRVAIATRIFSPEASAASFRLEALATALGQAGHEVTVVTTKTPKSLLKSEISAQEIKPFRVKRFPVLRDKTGYVRGYLQYMSFDIPLFFRLLTSKRFDAIIVEPPPTTGFVVRLISLLRRTPYFYYAADIWSDASASTGAPKFVVKVLRLIEKRAWRKATKCLVVNKQVAKRIKELEPQAKQEVIGNGIDTNIFTPNGPKVIKNNYFIYTGTASEWQGAEIFIDAVAKLKKTHPDVCLIFLGQGSALPKLQEQAQKLAAPVEFIDTVPPEVAAKWLRGATVAVASILPETGYNFAYPTKLFAAWASGIPTVFAGRGPARNTLTNNPFLGIGVDYEKQAVTEALEKLLNQATTPDELTAVRRSQKISDWANENVSLATIANKIATIITSSVNEKPYRFEQSEADEQKN